MMSRLHELCNTPHTREDHEVHVNSHDLAKAGHHGCQKSDHLIELVHLTVCPAPVLRHSAAALHNRHSHGILCRSGVTNARMLIHTETADPIASEKRRTQFFLQNRGLLLRQQPCGGFVGPVGQGLRQDGGQEMGELVAPVVRHHDVGWSIVSSCQHRRIGTRGFRWLSLRHRNHHLPHHVMGRGTFIKVRHLLRDLLPEMQEISN
mmetsp:Transcript_56258/g.114599  ORF Transcript_56258/g.114599 Transcript_56258/m.114599 type:complete len:206 (-) Transcript_56258:72-689(-)